MFFVTSLKNVSMSQFFLFQREETLLRTLRKTGELEKVCGGRKQPGGFLYKRSNCWGELLTSLLKENDVIIQYWRRSFSVSDTLMTKNMQSEKSRVSWFTRLVRFQNDFVSLLKRSFFNRLAPWRFFVYFS